MKKINEKKKTGTTTVKGSFRVKSKSPDGPHGHG